MPAARTSAVDDATSDRSELRLLTCGSVDDGKSTLIGRLLHEAEGIFDDQLRALRRESDRFGTTGDDLDFALLLDGLEAEREQGITIDVAWRYFSTPKRAFMVADTPGHEQYTRNMVTGASNAELAILLVDARKGVLEQTRRHAAIVSLLGIREIVLAVNKVDLVDFSEARFKEIEASFCAGAASLGFRSIVAIPLSARFGDNVAKRSVRTDWYDGPALLEHLERVVVPHEAVDLAFRFPVQWVNRPDSEFRGYAGTVAGGRVAIGDQIVVAGSGRSSRVARIVTMDGDLAAAESGRAITLTLADDIDIIRGDVLADPVDRPTVTRRMAADVVWMDEKPVAAGDQFLMKAGAATVPAVVSRIVDRLDIEKLQRETGDRLELNAIGRVWFETTQAVAIDSYADSRQTGSFILIDRTSLATAGAGMFIESIDKATNVHHQPEDVTPVMRSMMKAQRPLVVWLTGLPGAGKSTIANALERKLVALGRHTILLDGDNLRQGLNADLSFDRASRTENVRRVGELAKLMVDAGLIVIVALVSPYRADRDRAAGLLPQGRFLEVHVDTPLDICRQRDTKGLHRKMDAGKVSGVTGYDQPYEAPEAPWQSIQTATQSADDAANQLLAALLPHI